MNFAKFGAGCVVLSMMVMASNAFAGGATWNEAADGGGDAGNLPATAQDVNNGGGVLTNITGVTQAGNVQDMYGIAITDGDAFSAWTNGDVGGPGGSASFDTQLFLFDSAGMGVIGNDDAFPSAAPFHSGMETPNEAGVSPAPGNYYLAISGFNADPLSAGGAIFNQAAFDEQSSADGPGGALPITGWQTGGATGTYDIFLTGAAGVPEPATLGLLGIGALAMIRRRRAA
jgi:hypothetical protein